VLAVPIADSPPEPDGLSGLTVLVVEDDADLRELLEEFLTAAGPTCVVASSGHEALPLFLERHPDILISDIVMPDGDGLELIRRIRSLPPERGGLTPAIAVSGTSRKEEALPAGFHVVIAKPFDPGKLLGVIEEFSRVENQEPSLLAPWTISRNQRGAITMTFVGHVQVGDVKACMAALLRHMEKEPCEVVVDLTRLVGVSFVGASVAERAVWPMRHSFHHVRLVGGSPVARLVSSAACRMLGIECTVEAGARADA
jgi:CheY-like chemotaxis protein